MALLRWPTPRDQENPWTTSAALFGDARLPRGPVVDPARSGVGWPNVTQMMGPEGQVEKDEENQGDSGR